LRYFRGIILLAGWQAAFAVTPLAAQPPGALPSAKAQDSAAPAPASATTPAPASGENVIAFRDADQNRMTVPVKIAETGPYDFLIDTGAERSVISTELAQHLKLSAGPRAQLFDFSGVSIVDTVSVPSLSVSRLGTSAIAAPSLAANNLGALGMLGIDALQGHRVVIDFGKNRMTLSPAKHRVVGEFVVRAQDKLGQLIISNARFNGHPVAVVIDTGSWLSVGNSAMLALAGSKPRPFGTVQVTSVTGRSFKAALVTVDDLAIGDMIFGNFGLAFADAPPFERFGLRDKPALILGMNSLRLFERVEVDFVNREIAFTLPRPAYNLFNQCERTAVACHSLR
jgi:predicted aspartyl protease